MTAEAKRGPALPVLPDRYEALEVVARGGMATVLRAHDRLLDRIVAVKILSTHLAEDPDMVERFAHEARTAARLSGHPRIITIHDVGEAEGRPFIVMEYVPGGNVADAMVEESGHGATAGDSRQRRLRWIEQTAEAIDHAHAHGVVHRDIKPSNLLLDAGADVVVADFGIAKALDADANLTSTGLILGTAAYIAPEQVLGQPATEASDRYSLAVVAYELLTGRRPFVAEGSGALARARVETTPEPPSRTDPGLAAADGVMLRGLATDPARRWGSAREFADALRSSLAGADAGRDADATRPMTTAPLGAAPASRSSRGLARTAIVLAAAAAAVIAAVVLVSGGGSDQRRDRPAADAKTTTSQGTTTTAPAADGSAADSGSGAASGAALNDEGFRLLGAGRYDEAVPVLRRAVDAFGDDTDDLRYAYALFNLGKALRLSGDPAAAIPVLEQRLKIPNQSAAVQKELDAARAAVAGDSAAPAEQPRGKAKGKKKGD